MVFTNKFRILILYNKKHVGKTKYYNLIIDVKLVFTNYIISCDE